MVFQFLRWVFRKDLALPAPSSAHDRVMVQAEVEALALRLIAAGHYDESGFMFRIASIPGIGWVAGKSVLDSDTLDYRVTRSSQICIEERYGGRIPLADFIKDNPKVDLLSLLQGQLDHDLSLAEARSVVAEVNGVL